MQQIMDHPDHLLFPVRSVPVYAGIRRGSDYGMQRIPGQRAIVNCATDQVISVVSENYQVVTNREALHYAQLCCQAAFPESGGREWRVLQAHAPKTMGNCRIDLVHPASAVNFEVPGVHDEPEEYGPFVRVTNSYNRSRALRFEIGFIRWICSNGLIVPDSSIRFGFDHNTRKISERVRFEVKKDSFKQLRQRFRSFLAPLRECKIPLELFVPATLAVLCINKPEPLAKRQKEPWERLANSLKSISEQYSSNLGENGYALLNVITDVASRPPNSPFIRRERHGLQRSAGSWLAAFGAECRNPGFEVEGYVQGLREERRSPSGVRRAVRALDADTAQRA